MARPAGDGLIRWSFARHWLAMLLLGLGLGVVIVITGPAYVVAARAVGGGLSQLAREAEPVARSFQIITGPPDRLDSVGGYLSYKVFPDVALLLPTYAALQGAALVRGTEDRGVMDLWISAGRPRVALAWERVVGWLAALAVILVALLALTIIAGWLTSADLAAGAVGQVAGVGLVTVVAFGLSLLCTQVVASHRAAAAAVAGYMVGSFLIANMSDSLGAAAPLRYLSPEYYYLSLRSLVPGVGFGVVQAVVLAAAGALSIAAGLWLAGRRDVGAGIMHPRRPRAVTYTYRPSRVAGRWLWLSGVRERWVSLGWWAVAIGVFSAVEAAIIPEAIRLLRTSQGLGPLVTRLGLGPAQYLSAFLGMTALAVAGFAITGVARWVAEARDHRLDILLLMPIHRLMLLAERMVSELVGVAIIGLAGTVGIVLGAAIGGYDVSWLGLARTLLALVLLGGATAAIGMVLVTAMRNAGATAVAAVVLVVSLVLPTLAELLSWPAWTSWPSLIDAYATPYLSWPSPGRLVYLAALIVAGVIVAWRLMQAGLRTAD